MQIFSFLFSANIKYLLKIFQFNLITVSKFFLLDISAQLKYCTIVEIDHIYEVNIMCKLIAEEKLRTMKY